MVERQRIHGTVQGGYGGRNLILVGPDLKFFKKLRNQVDSGYLSVQLPGELDGRGTRAATDIGNR
jgi:hypothetical protein